MGVEHWNPTLRLVPSGTRLTSRGPCTTGATPSTTSTTSTGPSPTTCTSPTRRPTLLSTVSSRRRPGDVHHVPLTVSGVSQPQFPFPCLVFPVFPPPFPPPFLLLQLGGVRDPSHNLEEVGRFRGTLFDTSSHCFFRPVSKRGRWGLLEHRPRDPDGRPSRPKGTGSRGSQTETGYGPDLGVVGVSPTVTTVGNLRPTCDYPESRGPVLLRPSSPTRDPCPRHRKQGKVEVSESSDPSPGPSSRISTHRVREVSVGE